MAATLLLDDPCASRLRHGVGVPCTLVVTVMIVVIGGVPVLLVVPTVLDIIHVTSLMPLPRAKISMMRST